MNGFILLFVNLFTIFQVSDTLIPISNLTAFTHPKFFYSDDCECSRFNSNYLIQELYYAPTDSTVPYAQAPPGIIPANFDVGNAVIISAKQGDFFRINLSTIAPCDNNQEFDGKEFWIKKGTLGTWMYNYNDNLDDFDSVPLYEKPSLNSKIITQVEKENGVAIVLDIIGSWMLIETIKGEKKKGWLDPRMQCGNPYGINAGNCD